MKQPNVLITPTLLNSFDFAKNAPPSWKTKALKDLVRLIRREKGDFPLWIKKGIDFENAVYQECNKSKGKEITRGSAFFQTVCNNCIGGTFQNVFKKWLTIDDQLVLLYNKTDVVLPEKVIDIKTTLNWKGKEKYLKGCQHKMYLYASEKEFFEYIVAQWEDEESNKIQDIHFVEYTRPTLEVLEEELTQQIKELFDFLHQENLYDDYYVIFSNNRR